jgi:DNA polymerase-3 subunit alpha
MNWASLHNHSHLSLLDGYSKPKDMVKRCKEYGYKACALTDHGSISGCVDFFSECKKGGIKPILGCEFYISKDAKDRSSENKGLNHVVILAKNLQGWKELIRCVSESYHPDNFYYKPRIDYSIMKKNLGNGNHICISGHPGTAISESLFFSNNVFDAESYEEARAYLRPDWKESCYEVIKLHQEIFGNDFYLEIQLIDQEVLHAAKVIGQCLREIAAEYNIQTVATADSHYVDKSDAVYQRILLCSALKKTMPQINRAIQKKEKVPLKGFFISDNYHIPSPGEILALHTQEEIDNAGKIVDKCEEYNILNSPILPHFSCPDGMSEFEYLKHLCRKGWQELLVKKGKVSTQESKSIYENRIKEELEIIKDAGLSGYFLIVQDIVNWVRKQGWLPGPGRGSAAGCLISYLVGITSIDPIPFKLLFSRFYNSSRKGSLPDIDVDVPAEHRDEVIEYIKQTYGHENVSQMATFGRLQGRSAVKEVLRVEDIVSFTEMNEITKYIPDEAEISDELEEMEDKSIIRWALINNPKKLEKWCSLVDGKLIGDLADVFEKAIKVEGTYKSQGKHAAGIIIAASPLADICPMVRDSEGNPVAGFEMGDLESIGQVKFDILGVDILSKIDKIAKYANIDLDNWEDVETWRLLCEGDTRGVFQLESQLGKTWTKKLQPHMLEEGSALVALIRPGTLNAYFEGKSMTQHYIDRKSGKDEVKYFHPALEPILKDTYGVLVYQEQSMMIAREIAGFTEQEADNLRKAMGKKLADLMAKVKISFIEGAEKKGIVTKEEAEQIFEWIEASNRYSFNRCLDPTTTVNTKDEIKMLCELNLGDMILAPNKNGQDHYVEVIDIIHNGEKEVYEIETDSGHSIKCTLDHKFLCSDFITRPLYEILDQGYEIIVYNN